MVSILITEIPDKISPDAIAKMVFTKTGMKMLPPDSIFIDGEETKYDGQPGAWRKYYTIKENNETATEMYVLQHMFIYGKDMIYIQCAVGRLKKIDKKLLKEFNSYLPLFQQIGNSVIIYDKEQNKR